MRKFRITINTMFGHIEGVIELAGETSERMSIFGRPIEAVLVEYIVVNLQFADIELREIKDEN